jgi:hypothetical protein
MLIVIVYVAFCLATVPIVLFTNRLFGFFYAALSIYSVIPITGYLGIPGLSESLGAYFGDDVAYTATYYCLSTMILLFTINFAIYSRTTNRRKIFVEYRQRITRQGNVTLAVVVVTFIALEGAHFKDLSWYLSGSDNIPPSLTSFLLLYKMSPGFLTVCYAVWRSGFSRGNRLFRILVAIYAVAFVTTSAKLGDRTDPLALTLGVSMFEMSARRLSFKKIFQICAVGLIVAGALSIVEHSRYENILSTATMSERIVKNDYFAPAHILFAAIAYNIVDIKEVILSNIYNSMIMINHPYLQQTVMDVFRPGVANRSQSYAFFIFAEGWMVAGFMGCIYSAVTLTAGIYGWNKISSTSSSLLNIIIRSVLACMMVNLVRSQSSYFIKYLYTFGIPVFLFLWLMLGVRLVKEAPRMRALYEANAGRQV